MQKLLFISNFPFKKQMHGGQIRSKEIFNIYKRLGYDVKVAVIKPFNSHISDSADFEFIVPAIDMYDDEFEQANPFLSDYFCNKFVNNSIKKIISIVGSDYDVIHCEMPWLFDLASAIKSASIKNPFMIFGTENVECELKKSILLNEKINERIIESVYIQILALEKRAAEISDLILTVSDYDYDFFVDLSKKNNVILARNGISQDRFEICDKTVLKAVSKDYFVFVGSAHMPNVTGFGELFSHSLAFLPPDVKVVIVGGVSTMLERDVRYLGFKHINDTRIIRFNSLEEPKLNALLLNANAILLPLIDGGGSNLKTAEALFSNRLVIGTDKSFVGYESYKSDEGIVVANDPREFAVAMKDAISTKQDYDRLDLYKLTWDYTLKDLQERVGKLNG